MVRGMAGSPMNSAQRWWISAGVAVMVVTPGAARRTSSLRVLSASRTQHIPRMPSHALALSSTTDCKGLNMGNRTHSPLSPRLHSPHNPHNPPLRPLSLLRKTNMQQPGIIRPPTLPAHKMAQIRLQQNIHRQPPAGLVGECQAELFGDEAFCAVRAG